MDPHVDTAEAVMTRHRPRPWLAAVGIMRCVRRCGYWPCVHWLVADDRLRRCEDQAAIQRITDMLGLPADPVRDEVPPNRGHWGRS